MSTLESRKVNWLTLSLRDRLDIATLIAAGAASTLFLLLPVLPSLERSSAAIDIDEPQVVALAAGPDVDFTNATLSALVMTDARSPRPIPRRATARATRARKPLSTTVSTTTQARPPQSKLARLFLGDGSVRVQPFPMPDTRARR